MAILGFNSTSGSVTKGAPTVQKSFDSTNRFHEWSVTQRSAHRAHQIFLLPILARHEWLRHTKERPPCESKAQAACGLERHTKERPAHCSTGRHLLWKRHANERPGEITRREHRGHAIIFSLSRGTSGSGTRRSAHRASQEPWQKVGWSVTQRSAQPTVQRASTLSGCPGGCGTRARRTNKDNA